MTTYRQATDAELIADLSRPYRLDNRGRISYRHGVYETISGGRIVHRQHRKRKVIIENGQAFVMNRRDDRCKLTASAYELDGRVFVYDIRLDYLKPF